MCWDVSLIFELLKLNLFLFREFVRAYSSSADNALVHMQNYTTCFSHTARFGKNKLLQPSRAPST